MTLRARLICALMILAACSDQSGPETDPPALARSAALVSPSITPPPASNAPVVGGLAYVSMVPGTDADGQRVDVRNLRNGVSITAPMSSGGFDPLAVGAETGDTLSITVVHQAGGDTTTYAVVPIFARPTIVRTSPGMGRTDVPLNSLVLVVFSQPMDSASLPDALHLRHEGVDVPGSVIGELKEGVILSGRFVPASPLAPLSTYELSVSTGAQSQGGVPLDTPLTVEFTTTVAVTAPPGEPAAFPPAPAGALTYVRVSAEASGTVSRYVLYEDSTFARQIVTARWGFAETTGRYGRVNDSISLNFDANHGQWQATATIQGDSLVVDYNPMMELDDFVDGVYRLAPTPGPGWIYLAGADGSNPRRLITGERPAWSPDGRRIAFQRGGNIHLIGIDGTGETLLGEGRGREPAWHPDGARLAFTSAEGIAVMREDGSGATTLVRQDFRDDTDAESDQGVGKPAWSPDGDRIAFEHLGDGDLMPAQIFVMNADGSDLRRVTSTTGIQYAESDPAWSPDGSEIVFWSFGYGIAVVSAEGGTPRQIYQIGPAEAYGAKPVWSPDGSTILFAAYQPITQRSAIWLVAAHGGPAPAPIAEGADPAWSPDGAAIAFGRIDGASLRAPRR